MVFPQTCCGRAARDDAPRRPEPPRAVRPRGHSAMPRSRSRPKKHSKAAKTSQGKRDPRKIPRPSAFDRSKLGYDPATQFANYQKLGLLADQTNAPSASTSRASSRASRALAPTPRRLGASTSSSSRCPRG